MASQETLVAWEKAARAEDAEVKAALRVAYDIICRKHTKGAMKHPEAKVSMTLRAIEIRALRQFMMKFYDDRVDDE
jgi:hypothetical protein